jgi:hypothetical protein
MESLCPSLYCPHSLHCLESLSSWLCQPLLFCTFYWSLAMTQWLLLFTNVLSMTCSTASGYQVKHYSSPNVNFITLLHSLNFCLFSSQQLGVSLYLFTSKLHFVINNESSMCSFLETCLQISRILSWEMHIQIFLFLENILTAHEVIIFFCTDTNLSVRQTISTAKFLCWILCR